MLDYYWRSEKYIVFLFPSTSLPILSTKATKASTMNGC